MPPEIAPNIASNQRATNGNSGPENGDAPQAILESKNLTLISEGGSEFEALDQLGPFVQQVIKSERQDAYLDQLAIFIRRKEAEIELLCNSHYQVSFN